MKYDFDKIIDRRNTGSLKWDVSENELPMWVADMDFQTAPEIQQAIMKRAEHGIFGYSIIPDEWYNTIINWWSRKHNFNIEKNWLIFSTGVVPSISSIVRKLTTPAENIVFMTPVYNIFYNSVVNNGRNVLECPLAYNNENYNIDFELLEEKLSNPQTSMLILCNPHNPTGQVWSKSVLQKIGDLCVKHSVIVVSDEIHCDLTEPDINYTPFASVSENCKNNSITCIAPTKTFNIAGLQTSAVVVPNKTLRHKVWRGLNTDEIAEPNAFAVTASVAAFSYGEEWLNQLRKYISDNKKYTVEFISREIPKIKVVPSEATYLMWFDCSKITQDTKQLSEFIREKTGLYISYGGQFGGNGNLFLRFNVACPKQVLCDGLERLKSALSDIC